MDILDQTTYMCTIFAIGVFRGHESSQLSQKNHIASQEDEVFKNTILKEQSAFKQSIDWIGNLFIQASAGDVIAVAATINNATDTHKVVFHISNNIGNKRVVEKKKPNWTSFLQIMNTIKDMDLSKPDDLKIGSQLFLRHMVEIGWPRVQQKYGFIRQTVTLETFATLLQGLRKNKFLTTEDILLVYGKKDDNETDERFLERGIHGLKDDMMNLLDAAKDARSNPYSKTTDMDMRLKNINRGIEISKRILLVINSVLEKHEPGKPEAWGHDEGLKILILKLHNRLTRMCKYESGANVFLHSCLHIFRSCAHLAQTSQLHFEVEWVEEWILNSSFPTTTIESMTADTYLRKLGEIKDEIFKGREHEFNESAYDTLKHRVMNSLEDMRNKSLPLKPSLHCEISLAHYLEARELEPIYNFIGVTKLNCASCTRYFLAYNDAPSSDGVSYEMTGSSGKWHHSWFIPQAVSIRDIEPKTLGNMQERMRYACRTVFQSASNELYNILSQDSSPRSSFGSDSSTGSKNQLLVL